MSFDEELVKKTVAEFLTDNPKEQGLDVAFIEICRFLYDNPDRLSWRSRNKPSVTDQNDLKVLAEKFLNGFRKSDFPAEPGTIPDEMISIVMQQAYGYSAEQCEKIKVEHQHSMCAENCVGALLERYLDSVLRKQGWHWCCGDFIKAIDFISKDKNGKWLVLQIKNRDNTENSSSSAIRNGTEIQKWFRSFSKKGGTNWDNLPELMQGYNLSESGFVAFVEKYLKEEKARLNK
ncbi:Type II site-specific deoxyribonuclease [Stanieria cyanosphaera PCC 7437]|uniref:Type II site-specific deoxyribonuclease n=1 Tax=Stanieria cyanosphaera (strain ATCC 29371 / PCC 7437) TaxID=111780 RepID=K9XRY1_STAC7|nr:SinI family restriction endonuclease [Stanieria cyanosphaera]AFZ34432.1 Type II site-specific deoxyribonuclease [Stanieria cyanosphaera PCC 7437]